MSRHILAVDDERNIRRLVEVTLLRAGYRVSHAEDGVEALEKIDAERPDLVVLDVMMPRLDGFEVLKRLRENPKTADLPVVMLTAKAQDADIFRGWQSGADMYLTKPFNPMELLIYVKKVFASIEGAGGEAGGKVYRLDG
jgi:two-component system, OmpR family, alkaline phosphatase synthesis response regulator PhoP